jgi:adenosine deaminase
MRSHIADGKRQEVVEDYLRAIPKAELHLHLEGSIQPATVLELARRHRIDLPAADEAGLRRWFAFRDFDHFIEVYVLITRCLREVEDYALIVRELGVNLAAQNCGYAEVTFTPGTHKWLGIEQETWWTGLIEGRRQARELHGVEIRWVFDIVRNADFGTEEAKADYTLRTALEGMADGVVAFGLGGGEAGYPPEPWAPWFERAIAGGLRSAPHAGEHAGPDSIWGAINALGAERIGHGVRAIEDPVLVDYLREHHIPIELNPTSNVRLGVARSLEEHPLPRLLEAGVPLTVNSDDPPLFETTLTAEYLALAGPMSLSLDQVDQIALNGFRHSFLEPAEKSHRLAAAERELAELRRALDEVIAGSR